MDQIEMMMQKYGDKIQIGYKALRDQYFAYEIISTFMFFCYNWVLHQYNCIICY